MKTHVSTRHGRRFSAAVARYTRSGGSSGSALLLPARIRHRKPARSPAAVSTHRLTPVDTALRTPRAPRPACAAPPPPPTAWSPDPPPAPSTRGRPRSLRWTRIVSRLCSTRARWAGLPSSRSVRGLGLGRVGDERGPARTCAAAEPRRSRVRHGGFARSHRLLEPRRRALGWPRARAPARAPAPTSRAAPARARARIARSSRASSSMQSRCSSCSTRYVLGPPGAGDEIRDRRAPDPRLRARDRRAAIVGLPGEVPGRAPQRSLVSSSSGSIAASARPPALGQGDAQHEEWSARLRTAVGVARSSRSAPA